MKRPALLVFLVLSLELILTHATPTQELVT